MTRSTDHIAIIAGRDRTGPARSGGRSERRRQGYAARSGESGLRRRCATSCFRAAWSRAKPRPPRTMKRSAPDAFRQALARDEFAMHWEAHGHCYALPRAIDDDIRAGRTVIANVSRTVIAAMRRAYADVVVVSITAPPDVLAERLAMRRRAAATARSSTGSAAPSMMRAAAPDVTIINAGSAEYHARQFVRDHQGREVGRIASRRNAHVAHRDDRATRGDLRPAERGLHRQGRRPRSRRPIAC